MSKYKELPEQNFLLECFDYDKENGILTWLHRPRHHFQTDKVYNWWNGRFEGKAISNISKEGYVMVILYQEHFSAHRIIWKMVTGESITDIQIDHINQIRDDNRWDNLRLAFATENQQNKFIYKNNNTGVKGIKYDSNKDRYIARLQTNGVRKSIGTFKTLEEAERHIAAYRNKFHEDFSNYGDGATILKEDSGDFSDIKIDDSLYKHGSTTKVRGVTVRNDIPETPYMTRTTINGKRTILGYYSTIEEAKAVLLKYKTTGEYSEFEPKFK